MTANLSFSILASVGGDLDISRLHQLWYFKLVFSSVESSPSTFVHYHQATTLRKGQARTRDSLNREPRET